MMVERRYRVLELDDAIKKLYEGSLPPKSVVITFDDGYYDFYRHAFPALSELQLPATVYQTTYYCEHPYPIFNLVLSYIFWRRRTQHFSPLAFGIRGEFDLEKDQDRAALVSQFVESAQQQDLSPLQKDQLVLKIAELLSVDYGEIRRLRMLQLMNPTEIAEIASRGINLELHTHRHRTPMDKTLFTREIQDNRERLTTAAASRRRHFCYPSGQYRQEFLPWLKSEGILSATTCEYGIASRSTNSLLLPRQLDFYHTSSTEFEGSLSGFAFLLPHRG
jgi:peptidoglycan/xylan/chitin deacetylase (PgdA/CDA1 family)